MAGSITAVSTRTGSVLGRTEDQVYRFSCLATADVSAATFPDWPIPATDITGGVILSIRAKFGTTAPNSLKVDVKDDLGMTVTTYTFTASGVADLIPPISYTGPLTISFSTNTTNSATATVVLMVM